MYDIVVVHVVEAVEQLQHYALDLGFAKMIRHVVQQRSQVLLAILHDEKDAVEALADDHLLELDDVLVSYVEQQVDLAQAAYRQPILLLFHADALQRHDFLGLDVARSVHDAVRALANTIQLLILVHIPSIQER